MKIFEKEIKLQVMGYREVNHLITSDQSAYRNQHYTQTALHRVADDWLDNVFDGNVTGVCYFEITKCFDTINHAILLKKMYFLNFELYVIQLLVAIKSYIFIFTDLMIMLQNCFNYISTKGNKLYHVKINYLESVNFI